MKKLRIRLDNFLNEQPTLSVVHAKLLFWFESIFFYVKKENSTWTKSRKILLQYCKNKKVLDIGCGRGESLASLERTGSVGIGIDISVNMARHAQKNNPCHGYCVSDCLKLPFVDDAFDVTYIKHVIHHLPSGAHRRALDEAKRVTRNIVIVWDIVNQEKNLAKVIKNLYWKIVDGGYKYRTRGEWSSLFRGGKIIEEHISGRGKSTYIAVIEA